MYTYQPTHLEQRRSLAHQQVHKGAAVNVRIQVWLKLDVWTRP